MLPWSCLCEPLHRKSCMRRENVMRRCTDCMKSLTHWPTSPFLSYNLLQNIESLKERSGDGGGVEITRRTRLRERMHVRTIVGARDAFCGKMRARLAPLSSLLTQKLYKIEGGGGGEWSVIRRKSHLEPLIHLVWTGANWVAYRLNV